MGSLRTEQPPERWPGWKALWVRFFTGQESELLVAPEQQFSCADVDGHVGLCEMVPTLRLRAFVQERRIACSKLNSIFVVVFFFRTAPLTLSNQHVEAGERESCRQEPSLGNVWQGHEDLRGKCSKERKSCVHVQKPSLGTFDVQQLLLEAHASCARCSRRPVGPGQSNLKSRNCRFVSCICLLAFLLVS